MILNLIPTSLINLPQKIVWFSSRITFNFCNSLKHQQETLRSHSNSRADNTRSYLCLSVLRQDRNAFSQQLKNPHLTQKERQEYTYRLGEAEKRYERLKQRIYTGPDAKRQMEAYLNELQVLQSQWRHKYSEAKRNGDQEAAEFFAARLDLLGDELEHHTKSRSSCT